MRVGASVTDLNTPAPPTVAGTLGLIRVGTWPDIEVVRLTWDGTRWIGKPIRGLFTMTDEQFMQTSMPGWGYMTATSGTSPSGWCCIRPVRNAKALYAAGLHLQDRMSARFSGSFTLRICAGFFSYDNTTPLVFTNDHAIVEHPIVPYIECVTTDAQTWVQNWTTVVGVNAVNSGTINCASTALFAASGSFMLGSTTVTYSSKTATSFSGCSAHAALVGGEFLSLIPTGNPTTLNVDDTSLFAAGGNVVTSHILVDGIAIYYAGKTATSFTGLETSQGHAGAQVQKIGSFAIGTKVRQAKATDYPMSPEGIGKGTELVGDTTTGVKLHETPWTDIVLQVFNRNGEPQSPVVVRDPATLKQDLYLTPYATSAGGLMKVAALDYSMRWAS